MAMRRYTAEQMIALLDQQNEFDNKLERIDPNNDSDDNQLQLKETFLTQMVRSP